MRNEPRVPMARVAELQGRVSQVSERLRHDTLRLLELQQELSQALESAWAALGEPAPALAPPHVEGPRMLRLAEVTKKVGLSRSSIWRMVQEQRFPQPRQLATRAVR